MRSGVLVFAASFLAVSICIAAEISAISDVSISRPFFNPSLGQKIQISFALADSGKLGVLVLDRDGFPVRRLVSDKAAETGKVSLEWDGRDDAGKVVPDEAYSLKIDLTSHGKAETYFPALAAAEDVSVTTNYYDRRGATLSYKLPRASRVHIQAGVAQVDPATKKTEGPVLKTLVNREPRPAGAVIQNWNGFDEGGTFYVPDLPNFVTSIAATSLPDNSILTTGNRMETFQERAAARKGASLLPPQPPGHAHHRGLNALEDVAPILKAAPLNAAWSATEKVWRPAGKTMRITLSLQGPSAGAFERQPAAAYAFIGRTRVATLRSPHVGDTLSIPLGTLSPGAHVVAVNWASAYGPVAADAFRIVVGKPAHLQPAAFKRGSQ